MSRDLAAKHVAAAPDATPYNATKQVAAAHAAAAHSATKHVAETPGAQPPAQTQQPYPNCFGCGADNPIGLRLRYRSEGDALITEFTPQQAHEGWSGIVHGGIIAALLYEVMENFAYRSGTTAMMSGMHTQFRSPAKIGERITATARLRQRAGRRISVAATLTQSGVIAEGSAELVALTPERIAKLGIINPHTNKYNKPSVQAKA